MKLLFPLLLLSFASSSVWAEVPTHNLIKVADFKYEGNGCPEGSVRHEAFSDHVDSLKDGSAYFEIVYSQFGFVPRSLGGEARNYSACTIKLTLEYEPGYRFNISTISRTDFMEFDLPKDVEIKSTFSVTGSEKPHVGHWHYSGVGSDVSSPSDERVDFIALYSDCSGRAEITMETSVVVNSLGKANRDDEEIDDISMALVDGETVDLPFEKCK